MVEFLSTQYRAWKTILERGLKGLVATPTILDLVPSIEGFPAGSAGKESACNVGDFGSTPGLGRSLAEVMATHSSILAGESPWTEETGRLLF